MYIAMFVLVHDMVQLYLIVQQLGVSHCEQNATNDVSYVDHLGVHSTQHNTRIYTNECL